MGEAFKTEISFYEDCFKFTEESSLTILESITSSDELRHRDFELTEDLTYDHWVCSIMVALGEARVYIEAHFASRTARRIAAKGLRMEEKGLTTSVLIDFMREYLNRIMGDIKSRYLSDAEEVSLPQVTPAYDRGIEQGAIDGGMSVRRWKICWPQGQIVLCCHIVPTGDVTSMCVKEESEEEDSIDFL
tara:strand:+ start:339 stop:905 length:567 start_codon:yes stop_codon:yes gene_type:complete